MALAIAVAIAVSCSLAVAMNGSRARAASVPDAVALRLALTLSAITDPQASAHVRVARRVDRGLDRGELGPHRVLQRLLVVDHRGVLGQRGLGRVDRSDVSEFRGDKPLSRLEGRWGSPTPCFREELPLKGGQMRVSRFQCLI